MIRWISLMIVLLAFAVLPPPAHFRGATQESDSKASSASDSIKPQEKKADSSQKPSSTLDKPINSPDLLLQETAPRLAPIRWQDVLDFSNELNARGEPEAAKRILGIIAGSEKDYESLFVRLIQFGHEQSMEAAAVILRRWSTEFRQSPLPRFYSAVFHYQAPNKAELAVRDLAMLEGREPAELKPAIAMLRSLIQMAIERRTPGMDDNPWSVRFVDEQGKLAIGSIAGNQAAKIPVGSIDALAAIVRLLPHNGNLWALLGEMYNAAGETKAALQCFRNANQLGYQPRSVRERIAMLTVHQKEVEKKALEAIANAKETPTSSSEDPAPPARFNILEHKDILAISIVGTLLLLGIVVLQVRDWIRRGTSPDSKRMNS